MAVIEHNCDVILSLWLHGTECRRFPYPSTSTSGARPCPLTFLRGRVHTQYSNAARTDTRPQTLPAAGLAAYF